MWHLYDTDFPFRPDAPGIIEKIEEPRDIIPNHIDETLKERKMKYPKIVKALDNMLYLIESIFLIERHRKQLQTVAFCEIQEMSSRLFDKLHIAIFYHMSKFIRYYEKTSPI